MVRSQTTFAALLAVALLVPAPGAQTVFTEDAALVASGTVAFDDIGRAVALDGDVILAGFQRTSAEGATVFRREDGVWTEERTFSSPLSGACDFGRAVAVDGPLAAVSDPGWESSFPCAETGTLHALHDAGVGFAEQGIYGGSGVLQYGVSLAIRGEHMVAGSPGDPLKIGVVTQPAVVPHDWNGTSWVQGTPITGSGTSLGDDFGASVALSADGGTLLVGAFDAHVSGTIFAGEAYVFRRVGGTWTEEARLLAPDGSANDHFGASVAVNDDGTACAVGAARDDTPIMDAGSVYVYRRQGRAWSVAQNFGSPIAVPSGRFGDSMAMSGTRLLVGEPGNDFAHVYRDVGSAYVPLQRLQSSLDTGSDRFGAAVALDGGRCVVGAPSASFVGAGSGVAYVFELPDLALTADVETVPVGGKVRLATRGGVPGTPCVLSLELRSAGASLGPVAWGAPGLGPGVFGPEGQHALAFASPIGLSGLTVTFRAHGEYEPGVAGSSNAVTVAFD